MTKEQYLEKLLPSYKSYFDIETDVQKGSYHFPAIASFHSRSEKFILTKSAKIWATEMNEYLYFSYADTVTTGHYNALKDFVLQDGLAQVKPHNEHMYSYVSLVLIADVVSNDVIQEIQKTKFYKSFRFSFYGWMHLRIAVVDLSNGKVYSNKQGKEMVPLLQSTIS